MYKQYFKFFWIAPLIFHSLNAHAWGLVTHVYFAQQWLIWGMPLLDPRLRQAVQKFPELVMAGACLPDLALVSPSFRHTHQWETCREMLLSASSDEEIAISIGYASHLFVDVVAHNHFVPAHEAMWFEKTLITHIASEWAVDAHVSGLIQNHKQTTPYQLLQRHRSVLIPFLAQRFRCGEKRSTTALDRLANADRFLRTIRLPQAIYYGLKRLDNKVFHNFEYYVSLTRSMLPQMDSLLNGSKPLWEADPSLDKASLSEWRQHCLSHMKQRHPTPIAHYSPAPIYSQNIMDNLAMMPPSKAPTSTSVG
ncbi:MAG TPA: zinc dependent phospholipase C family protein [Methylophilaceae bacterium]|jgi:hypothetical protein